MAMASTAARTGRVNGACRGQVASPASSSMTTNDHFWVFFDDPVHRAASRMASTSAAGNRVWQVVAEDPESDHVVVGAWAWFHGSSLRERCGRPTGRSAATPRSRQRSNGCPAIEEEDSLGNGAAEGQQRGSDEVIRTAKEPWSARARRPPATPAMGEHPGRHLLVGRARECRG